MVAQKNLSGKSSEYVKENFLQQNPEDLAPCNLVVGNTMPEPSKMVRFIFHNQRDPGVALHFHYHSKNHPLKHYTLFHGLEHELPQEIVDHLESVGEPQYGERKTADGHPEPYVKGHKYIFRCQTRKSA